jgi:hypothetical protein
MERRGPTTDPDESIGYMKMRDYRRVHEPGGLTQDKEKEKEKKEKEKKEKEEKEKAELKKKVKEMYLVLLEFFGKLQCNGLPCERTHFFD